MNLIRTFVTFICSSLYASTSLSHSCGKSLVNKSFKRLPFDESLGFFLWLIAFLGVAIAVMMKATVEVYMSPVLNLKLKDTFMWSTVKDSTLMPNCSALENIFIEFRCCASHRVVEFREAD